MRPELNSDGTPAKLKVWRSLQSATRYLAILENAFVRDAELGCCGENFIAAFDMNVRARIRELSVANDNAAFGDLRLMSLDDMAAGPPSRGI